jgi:hypothetical protein
MTLLAFGFVETFAKGSSFSGDGCWIEIGAT